MMRTRRQILATGGGGLATLLTPRILRAQGAEVVEMRGTARGERIWFAPLGLAVAPGTIVRFVNRDPGNSHTATAYHPENFNRAARIPEAAMPWHSDYLLPEESFDVTLDVPGVYDYYCLPHEMAGMVGRIVVGRPSDTGWQGSVQDTGDLPDTARGTLPDVDTILAKGRVYPEVSP
ncbi:MAG: plastocyanin/azurin family copper-binding protein [Roseovarius sp.]|nr:plastocyanin/azurin family copper-binding protein [Roseovarius sp.]